MQKRILVHIQRGSSGTCRAHFTQSIVDSFDGKHDVASVYVGLRDNKLFLSDRQQLCDYHLARIKRPAFCPVHSLTPSLSSQLSESIRERGVDVGCALILEASDGRVLLTRRAAHLRTFPGVWVPPGGHLEENETFADACLRELKEETGLNISTANCSTDTISTLALWESCYPPMLSRGLPLRHHVVVYAYTKLCDPLTSSHLQTSLRLDEAEVAATTWLTRSMVASIVSVFDDDTDGQMADVSLHNCDEFPDTIEVTEVSDGRQSVKTVSSRGLLNCAPATGDDVERVSTGTKFALHEWLSATASTA